METTQASGHRQAVHWVAYQEAPLDYLARLIITEQKEHLPDLSHTHILLSEPGAAKALRNQLLKTAQQIGVDALLGVKIETLKDWAYQHLPGEISICNPQSQELILIDALNQHPELLGSTSPWVMAENLLNLFSELTLKHIQLPDSPDAFLNQLQKAYGGSLEKFSALGEEAHLVHTLWQAWHTQLQAEGLSDTDSAYLHGLASSLQTIQGNETFYVAGFHQFIPAEIDWIKQLSKNNQLRLLLHGNSKPSDRSYHPDTPNFIIQKQLKITSKKFPSTTDYCQFLDSVFDIDKTPLQKRAQSFCERTQDSPAANRLAVFHANNTENEAHAIELQIRRWLSNSNYQRIGIVTENRRLARRVRAMLERSQIPLQDASGWALSTTSAAATIERWLECIEEDFDYLALLDLMKSPFLFTDIDSQELKKAVYRFEQDIVRHENISRNLEHYLSALNNRRSRLDWSTDTYLLQESILNKLKNISEPLQKVLHSNQRLSASKLLNIFLNTLTELGIYRAFEEDMAGQRFLYAIKELEHAALKTDLDMNWTEFRTWLGRHLERINFQPIQQNSPVQLMGLSQSRLQQFDALIIAGAEQEYLPGRVRHSPFFNDNVRKELNLSTTTEQLSERLHHFRRLLESAPRILITLRAEENGEAIAPSPWLEAIQSFHIQTYGKELDSPTLTALVEQYNNVVIEDVDTNLPGTSKRATPSIISNDLPKSYSSTAYQKVLDCPYRFYASYCLKLKPTEEVSEALARDEYGRRIHRCLQAFHTSIDDLPGPFKQELNNSARDAAIQTMNEIAIAVFATDDSSSFEYQAWLQQWLNIIPYYIEWEIDRQKNWKVFKTEEFADRYLDDNTLLKGQLDRIDINSQQQLAVIDYKTGQIPSKADVLDGEYVQLPFYALLNNNNDLIINEVAYLQVNKAEKISPKVSLEKEQLDILKDSIAMRLKTIIDMMQSGKVLPAWGDSKTCSYCEMDKLCRRQAWQDNGK